MVIVKSLAELKASPELQSGIPGMWRVQLRDSSGRLTCDPVICIFADRWVFVLPRDVLLRIQQDYIERSYFPRIGLSGQKASLDKPYGLLRDWMAQTYVEVSLICALAGQRFQLGPRSVGNSDQPSFFVYSPVASMDAPSLVQTRVVMIDAEDRCIVFEFPTVVIQAVESAWTPP